MGLVLPVMTGKEHGTKGSLLDLETGGLSFIHLAKLCCLIATLQNRE